MSTIYSVLGHDSSFTALRYVWIVVAVELLLLCIVWFSFCPLFALIIQSSIVGIPYLGITDSLVSLF